MYTITKSDNTIKTELCVKSGEIEKIYKVNLHVEDVISKYNNLRRLLGEADRQRKEKQTEESYKQLGEVIVELIRIIFGDEQASDMIDFYENRVIELLLDVVPFINNEIQPKMDEVSSEAVSKYLL